MKPLSYSFTLCCLLTVPALEAGQWQQAEDQTQKLS
jgi:hypothetical protein